MGNYKSRPHTSCADELKKKISENYVIVRSHLQDDLRLRGTLSPLQEACCQNNKERLSELLEDNNIHEKTDHGLTLFHCCAITGAVDCVNILLKSEGVKSDCLSKHGFTALHLAAYKGDVSMVTCLLDSGVKLGQMGYCDLQPIHVAIICGHTEMTKLLLDRGADIDTRDANQFSPLHLACNFGHDKIVEMLIERGADVNVKGGVGDRPVHLAAAKGYLKVVQKLVEGHEHNKAQVNVEDDEKHTPLHFCSKAGHVPVMNYLLDHQEEPHTSNMYGDTPLHLACYNGKYETAKQLVSRSGSDSLVLENIFSETPLHSACTSGKSIELVTYLISEDAVNINRQGKDGHTALHSACYHGHTRVVKILLDNKADANLVATVTDQLTGEEKKEDQTCLLWAYEQGHDDIVTLLKHYKQHEGSSGSDLSQHSGDSSYVSVPSPLGKLRSITKEKMDVLHLRSTLPHHFQLQVSDLDIQEPIGSGSFGKVFKGWYRGKPVAVKRYKASSFFAKSDVEMFCREVSILSKLNSSYVINFVGACIEDPSQFAFVTLYMAGGSVYSILHEQKRILDMHSKLTIALDVAKGMNYLHTLPQPIIHRDLNSHNILLDDMGHAVVADFGESRFLKSQEDNMTKQPGNLRWMAPEVFMENTKYSVAADVFSFALCLWELLSVELPLAHLKPAAAAADMAYHGTRPLLSPVVPDGPRELIEKAWHQNPDKRPEFKDIISLVENCFESGTEVTKNEEVKEKSPTVSSVLPPVEECSSDERESEDDLPLAGHVSALRSRWESEASRNSSGVLEELKQKYSIPTMNKNGYVLDPLSTVRLATEFNQFSIAASSNSDENDTDASVTSS